MPIVSLKDTSQVASGKLRRLGFAISLQLLTLGGLFGGAFSIAHAQVLSSVIISQEDDSVLDSGSGNGEYQQILPNTFSGVASSSFIHVAFDVNTSAVSHAFFFQITDGMGNQCVFQDNYPNAWSVGHHDVTLLLDSLSSSSGNGCSFSAGDTYTIIITRQSGNIPTGFQLYGSQFLSSQFASSTYIGGTSFTQVANIFFRIAGTYQQIGVNNPYLVGVSTSTVQSFCNSSFATSSNLFTQFASDFSNGLCNVGSFLFIPNQTSLAQFTTFSSELTGRFPFSWYIAVKGILNNLQASSTANYPTYSYDLSAYASTSPYTANVLNTGTLLFVNPTIIQTLAPDSTWSFLRSLLGYILYVAFAYYVYRKIVKIWQEPVT